MPLTEAQKRAQKKYDQENREKRNLTKWFHTAKAFIQKTTNKNQLAELSNAIKNRLNELKDD